MRRPTEEQSKVIEFKGKDLVVSASAGSGKTSTIIEKISSIVKDGTPINRLLVITYTRAAANEMKSRLLESFLEGEKTPYILDQIDEIGVSDISTVHSFLEKMIKRNTHAINLPENFRILDENENTELKIRALKEAEKRLSKDEEFENLFINTHEDNQDNQNFRQSVVFALYNHLAVQSNRDERLEYYKNNQKEIFNKAERYLNEIIQKSCRYISDGFDKLLHQVDEKSKYFVYFLQMRDFFEEAVGQKSLRESLIQIRGKKPLKPRVQDDNYNERLYLSLRGKIDTLLKKFEKIQIDYEDLWLGNPREINAIYKLYELFAEELDKSKIEQGVIDFNDLERFAMELLKNDDVFKDIIEDYDYIFVDEYQDINPVQEKIIKKLKENSKFVAVGDPKQGIYGFRNATPEIMKNDIKNLEVKDSVLYLKSNFRSDKYILDFVNDVFKNIMTEDFCGIDYFNTAMFRSPEGHFEDGNKSVIIDTISHKETGMKKERKKIYNIFEDELIVDEKNKLEAEDICYRISQFMKSEIYDSKLGKLRPVKFSDIAILTRNRGDTAENVLKELEKHKFPVMSVIRRDISNTELDVIINLLKISVDPKDDIAIASVMLSKLGGFDVDQLSRLCQKGILSEVFENDDDTLVFRQRLDRLKKEVLVKGIKFALENLFDECEYIPYLLNQEGGINTKLEIERVLQIIGESDFNFDIPATLKMLEEGKLQMKNPSSSENAITMTTIHGSKGLEYPIVFLIGCGKSVRGNNREQFAISSNYGVAINHYGEERKISLLLKAVREEKLRREYIDELMVLYVALTRAKNHLVITGVYDRQRTPMIDSSEDLSSANSYMDIILGTILNSEDLCEGVEVNTVNSIEEITKDEKSLLGQCDERLIKEINDYLDFSYPYEWASQTRYKNTVTGLNKSDEEIHFVGGGKNLDTGIAYHEALKVLDFDKINSLEDISLEKISGYELIDKTKLFRIIQKIKDITKKSRIFKEKQFTMKIDAGELEGNLTGEEIMVQGVVDLFAVGNKNILIDYKWTNDKDADSLLNRYKKQLFLYQKAIEKGLKIKLDEMYLFSLKYEEIIKLK